jgi:hypothetical protein
MPIESRIQVGRVEIRNAYRNIVAKSQGKIPLKSLQRSGKARYLKGYATWESLAQTGVHRILREDAT